MLDTKGPEIRTGTLRDAKPVDLVAGQELLIVTDYSIEGDNKKIACSYKNLPNSVDIGSTIYIADGAITCEVIEKFDVINYILCLNILIIGRRESHSQEQCQTW
jgi:pyruvate kinase